MQSGQHYQSAMSSGLWFTLQEFKKLRCIYGRKCAVLEMIRRQIIDVTEVKEEVWVFFTMLRPTVELNHH